MSQPRRVQPGSVYLVTRRTTRRTFLFRPDSVMTRIFVYCLATMVKKFGIEVHAAILMSTHLHLVITDVRGVAPQFLEAFHRYLANSTKRYRGWAEEVFNKSQTSMVELLTPQAIVDAMAYVITNGVPCGAVRYADEWPGFLVRAADIGKRVFRADRPTYWFRAIDGRWPPAVELRTVLPAVVLTAHRDEEGAREVLRAAVEDHEQRARKKIADDGGSFLGRDRVLAAEFTRCATSPEAWVSRNPRFAAAGDKRAMSTAVGRLRDFLASYRVALTSWRSGERDVEFPSGTWAMRLLHGAMTATPDG